MAPLQIETVPALKDNYAYLVHDPDAGLTAVVDPSEPGPIEAALARKRWKLTAIWNTHHHWDHVGGNVALKEKHGCRIVANASDAGRVPGFDDGVTDGSPLRFGGRDVIPLAVPGHTLGAIAYWIPGDAALFTGDTLFLAGCGRLFEGTPEQMWKSLAKLRALPPETRVFCGHEYTVANLRFALALEPDRPALVTRAEKIGGLRGKGRPTVPATLAEERETNPFLRADDPALQKVVGLAGAEPTAVFAEIRRRKDSFL